MVNLTLDTKKCMAELLLRDTFHEFLFIEGEITTFNKFSVDGLIRKEFYKDSPDEETIDSSKTISYSPWKKLKEFCFSIIKGKRTPLDFKFIFTLSEPMIEQVIKESDLDFRTEDVQGLYLNFRYDGSTLTCITGTSLKTFTLDKSLEHAFDKWTGAFFSAHDINWNKK